MKGIVFDIQRFSIHDGPGIRTTVFLKGCPLRCPWCHNPESIRPNPELMHFEEKCIGCGGCVSLCRNSAVTLIETKAPAKDLHEGSEESFPSDEARSRVLRARVDRNLCIACGRCAEACPSEALVISGKQMTAEEVIAEVEKDRVFYETSGGGVTLSGGEPMMQPEFAMSILDACHSIRLHTVLDTSGYARTDDYRRLLPFVDLVLYDLKHMNPEKHREFTGVSNEIILENLREISRRGVPIVVRVPIIPGYNDSEENIEKTAEFVRLLPTVVQVDLLPYHRIGEGKYKRLGCEYMLAGLGSPAAEHMNELRTLVNSFGLKASA